MAFKWGSSFWSENKIQLPDDVIEDKVVTVIATRNEVNKETGKVDTKKESTKEEEVVEAPKTLPEKKVVKLDGKYVALYNNPKIEIDNLIIEIPTESLTPTILDQVKETAGNTERMNGLSTVNQTTILRASWRY